jgi:hypothetical protein
VNRFTHQTGQITDVDKHMMAYVEAQMSRRRGDSAGASSPPAIITTSTTTTATTATIARSSSTPSNQESSSTPSAAAVSGGGKSSYWAPTRPEARGATLGKLHEVDLGEEVKQRNIALTAQALSGQPATSDSSHRHPSDAKGGGGRRHKRRRNSQDIERDRLVEEVLKETRLDLYPEDVEEKLADDEEGAADDKIAEKFRKEFIDAILSKRRRRGGEAKAKGNKKEDKKRPKGPKLGGSRMARAQMREQQGTASGAGARK